MPHERAGNPPAPSPPRRGNSGWSAIGFERGRPPRCGAPPWGGEFACLGCLGVPGFPPPRLVHPRCPPPPGFQGRPPKGLPARGPCLGAHTCCATAVSRVSEISTTSARQSATVCQCRHRDVTLASATRMGPGWGSTSPHCRSKRGGRPCTGGGEGGHAAPAAPAEGGGRGNTNPPQTLVRQWSGGTRSGVRGAASHACRLIFLPSPAAPRAGRRTQGGRAGRWRGRRRGERCPAAGKRQGGWPRTRGAALLPVSSEAEGLLEDFVQAVPARHRPNSAVDVGPPCRGMGGMFAPGARPARPRHATFRLCSPRRAPKHTPWKRP